MNTPQSVQKEEYENIIDSLPDEVLKHLIDRISASVREETLKEATEALENKYQQKKQEPMPAIIPKASPSRSHYKERRQGALSGLLIAKDILSALTGLAKE